MEDKRTSSTASEELTARPCAALAHAVPATRAANDRKKWRARILEFCMAGTDTTVLKKKKHSDTNDTLQAQCDVFVSVGGVKKKVDAAYTNAQLRYGHGHSQEFCD